MKRDWDLLRWILSEAESARAGYPLVLTFGSYSSDHDRLDIGDRDFEEVYEHILLLGDSGLAEVRNLGQSYSEPIGAVIDRLTMAGHDFLDAARNDTLWRKAKETVNEKGGAVTVGIFVQILSALAKQQFGLL